MSKKIKTLLSISSAVLIVLLSFFAHDATAAPAKKVNLKLWGGPIGSSGYVLSFGLAEIINKYSNLIHINAMETKGWSADIMGWQLLPAEEAKYLVVGGVGPIHVKQGRDGEKPLKGPFMEPRCISLISHMPSPWATADPKLKKAEDLMGKRIIFWWSSLCFYIFYGGYLRSLGIAGGEI